jgi:hypothetical protein
MRYVIGTLRVLAWSWTILVIVGICSLAIYLNGFSEGMHKASLIIFSPKALYIFTPSFVLAGLAAITRRISEASEETI